MFYKLSEALSALDICKITGGRLKGENRIIQNLAIDSREKMPGGVFVCIKGERVDGHNFISSAASNGADCVICERELDFDITQIIVDDSIKALGKLGQSFVHKSKAKIVAITGSVGKTTTKQMISSVLGRKYSVIKNEGNLNSLIGLPLSLLSLGKSDDYGVFEMGMSALGEISEMSRMTSPDISVITNIGSAHLEFLKTRENIAKAKLEILDGAKRGCPLFTTADEPLLENIKNACYISEKNSNSYCFINNERFFENTCLYDATVDGKLYSDIEVKGTGYHIAYDSAIALCVGLYSGIGEDDIRLGLSEYEITGERQKIYNTVIDGKRVKILSDCYNASPESMRASLSVLENIEGKRKNALLGDMLELGENTSEFHRLVGEYARSVGIGILYAVGENSRFMADAFGDCCRYFADKNAADEIAECIKSEMADGDVLLVKASHSIGLESVVKKLIG